MMDEVSIDSDLELQAAFSEGKLKPGLYRGAHPVNKATSVLNIPGLEKALRAFNKDLFWVERLDVTVDLSERLTAEEKDNDLKREMIFYEQAQGSALIALKKLTALGYRTRPDDYFAEMAKSDSHMEKVRNNLMERKNAIERSQHIRQIRALKKMGKEIQTQVVQSKQKEKKDLKKAVLDYRKGKQNTLQELLEGKMRQPNKKRQMKNEKWGFGGQKKRSKRNDKESFSVPYKLKNSGSIGSKKGGVKKRPGKMKRQKQRSRK